MDQTEQVQEHQDEKETKAKNPRIRKRCPPPCGKRQDMCKEHGPEWCKRPRKNYERARCPPPCGKRKDSCKEHGTDRCRQPQKQSAPCECKLAKEYCVKHGGSRLCVVCKYIIVSKRGTACAGCTMVASERARIKEKRVAAFLGENVVPVFTRWNKTIPNAGVCGRYFPDFVWEMTAIGQAKAEDVEAQQRTETAKECRAVVLEIDEHQHAYASYPLACELSRMGNIVQSYGGLPVHMIRYNPDSFKVNSFAKKPRYPEEVRLATLATKLKEAFENPDFAENLFTLQYLFYDNEEGPEILQTYKFKSMSDYVEWMDQKIREDEFNKASAAGAQGLAEETEGAESKEMEMDGDAQGNNGDDEDFGKTDREGDECGKENV